MFKWLLEIVTIRFLSRQIYWTVTNENKRERERERERETRECVCEKT